MYKVFIEKREPHPAVDCEMISVTVSIDATKPYDITIDEWGCIKEAVKTLADGSQEHLFGISGPSCRFDLSCITEDKEFGIIATSEHYYIRTEYEDASLFRIPDSKRITCVGDFYGNPEDAYIDPEEKFCVIVGCGIIKYNLSEPFEEYTYNTVTDQWVETGRDGDIEWCDHIEAVTDSHIIVSCEGTDERYYYLRTLKKVPLA